MLTIEERESIIDLCKKGYSRTSIADELDICIPTVLKVLRECGMDKTESSFRVGDTVRLWYHGNETSGILRERTPKGTWIVDSTSGKFESKEVQEYEIKKSRVMESSRNYKTMLIIVLKAIAIGSNTTPELQERNGSYPQYVSDLLKKKLIYSDCGIYFLTDEAKELIKHYNRKGELIKY